MLTLLERRRLLSSSVVSGVLVVNGDDNANAISITLTSTKLKVVESGLPDKYYPSASVSKIQVNGNGGGDRITIGSVSQNATLKGGGGNDTITGGPKDDLIEGNSGNDSLIGGGGSDGLHGGSGNDVLEGDSGHDYMSGGTGSDTVTYRDRTADDYVIDAEITVNSDGGLTGRGGGPEESDSFIGIECLEGGGGADTLFVSGGANDPEDVAGIQLKLDGAGGGDWLKMGTTFSLSYPTTTLKGGEGHDKIRDYTAAHNPAAGDGGNDIYYILAEGGSLSRFAGGSGKDRVDGGGMYIGHGTLTMPSDLEEIVNFNDVGTVVGNSLENLIQVAGLAMTIKGGSGSDVIYGGSQNDSLFGEGGWDTIYGGDGDDVIDGGSGNDSIRGGSGKDKITGGSGNDKLYGESGNDTLYGKDSTADSLYGGSGTDKAYRDAIDLLSSIETTG